MQLASHSPGSMDRGGRLTQKVSRDCREIFRAHASLRHSQAVRNAKSHENSDKDLVADPFLAWGSNTYRVEEPQGHGRHHGTAYHDGHGVARLHHHGATDQGEDGRRKDQGKIVDAGLDGADALDTLEVDGQVVQQHDVGAEEEELERRRGPQRPHLVQPRRHRGVVAQPYLPGD